MIPALFFLAWVLVDAEVLAKVRDPLTNKATGTLAYFLTCRVCIGFWVSLALHWITGGDWEIDGAIRLLEVNGWHLGLVTLESFGVFAIRRLKNLEVDRAINLAPTPKTPAGGDLVAAVKEWAEDNRGDTPVIEEFLEMVRGIAPDITLTGLHDALNSEEDT